MPHFRSAVCRPSSAGQYNANRFGAIETLEKRVLMAATASAIRPVIHELLNVSTTMTAREATKFKRAGAQLFDGVAKLGASRNGSTTPTDLVTNASAFTIELSNLRQTLANAPLEFTAAAAHPLTLAIPTPNGTYARFSVVEAPIMEAGLAAQFPGIKTFRGQGIDDPSAAIRFDYTQLGFHAQVLSPNGAFYINPQYFSDAAGTYLSYYKHDAVKPASLLGYNLDLPVGQNNVHIDLENGETTVNGGGLNAAPFGSQLRTFRAAVGANHQYAAVFGGTVANAQAAIVTAMNRVTGVYETELAVRMTLVANNTSIIFASATGDPWTSNNGSWVGTGSATSTINGIIGSANYDIGHEFTTGSGGVALLGVVGNSSVKADGTTGLPSPTGDAFYIDYVAHEIGHQFGANHTFNSSDGQRSASHAYEPGSGSTIMAYAGLFGADNIQPNSDPYMHSDSIDAIRTFVTSTIPGVGTTTSTGNNAPTVSALTSYSIPTGTPFALTGSATDPDGNPLTYEWQERELGPAGGLTLADNGSSPMNRAIVPTVSPTRLLPRLSAILNGTNQFNNSSGRGVERLYTVARTANPASWRLLVRDNRSGGGGVASQDVNIQVVNTGSGAFLITNNNSVAGLLGNQTLNVAWNVAGTTANGINVANVKISMSTDNGNTFPTVLAASAANDGSEDVTVPNVNASNVRIKVEAEGNIFFDINNAALSITQQSVANGTWTGLGDGVNWNQGTNWTNNTVPGPGDAVTINSAGNPTINVVGAQSVLSVNSSEALNITGTLSVAQASTFSSPVTLTGGTFSGNGNATFTGGLTWNGGSMTGSGNSTIPLGANLSVTGAGVSTSSRSLVINGTGSLATGGNKVLVINSLTVGGLLDLNDNDLVIDYTGGTQLGTAQSQINAARNGGDWLGTTGITSTSARNASPRNTTLGAIEGSSYLALNPGSPFSGATIDTTSVLVKYTWYGDVDFNGVVDFDDYSSTDAGFNTGLTGWLNGDADGNGGVDFDDYSLIDQAFNTQSGTL